MKKNLIKFWLDVAIAVTFSLLFTPEITSLPFHEIAGIILGFVFIIHILLNIKWVIGISKKLFSKTIKNKAKFTYLLNLILFIDMLIIMVSGLLISKIILPDFRYFTDINWMPIHIVSSIIGLFIVGIHVGLHWNWIKQIGSRFPKFAKLFSFHKPTRRVVSSILLIIGTIAFLAQVPKVVILTPAIFSDEASFQFKEGHRGGQILEEGREFDPPMEDRGNRFNRGDGEFGQRDGRDGFGRHHREFSFTQLIFFIPVVFLYTTIVGAIAFYTYLVEKRSIKRPIRTS